MDDLSKKHIEEKKQRDKKIKDLENMLKNHPKKQKVTEKLKCSECEYETTTKRTLNAHIAKKHTNLSKFKYPANCELCDEELKDEKEVKLHMKSHTYSELNFKCENCNYWSYNALTMEVHVGKHHAEKLECGLCEYKVDNLESLKIHLSTCEVYECNRCFFRVCTLSEIKKHIKEKHEDDDDLKITHGKVNRKDEEEIDENELMKHEIFP